MLVSNPATTVKRVWIWVEFLFLITRGFPKFTRKTVQQSTRLLLTVSFFEILVVTVSSLKCPDERN